MAHPFPFLFVLFALLLPSPSSAIAGNVLLSGDVYPLSGHILSVPINAFVNDNDWNLALHNNGRRSLSNARRLPSNCTLTLTDRGQLLIRTPDGSTFWSSSAPGKTGRYAAVFRPDGHVTLFGPSIWSTPQRGSVAPEISDLAYSPNARNLMFSSQVLDGGSKLASGEHELLMKDDCSLQLVRATEGGGWESGTKGMGRNCFARLDHRGQIAVVDGFKVVWATKAGEEDGLYVLIVQNDGRAAVYGPAIWSASAS